MHGLLSYRLKSTFGAVVVATEEENIDHSTSPYFHEGSAVVEEGEFDAGEWYGVVGEVVGDNHDYDKDPDCCQDNDG